MLAGTKGNVFCANDAVVRCGNYEGEYSGVYSGGSIPPTSGFDATRWTVNLDGCTIGTSGYPAFKLATAATANISNSALASGATPVSFDGGTLNVGIGSTIADSAQENVTQTDDLYRKKHPDAVMNGKDFEAIAGYLEMLAGR
jgi:hypothetical protein